MSRHPMSASADYENMLSAVRASGASQRELAAALSTINELEKRIAELERELEQLSEPTLKHMHMENGQIDMAVTGPMIERLALAMTGYFHNSGAKNYVEINLNSRSEPFERYCVTVQKVGERSPHQLRQEAEQALAAERKRREECEAVLREVAGAPNRIAENSRIIADYFGEGN